MSVGWLVGPLVRDVCEKVNFRVSKGTKTYLWTYLQDSSDSSDGSDSNDSSDSSDSSDIGDINDSSDSSESSESNNITDQKNYFFKKEIRKKEKKRFNRIKKNLRQSQIPIVIKLKSSNCDEPQKLKLLWNS